MTIYVVSCEATSPMLLPRRTRYSSIRFYRKAYQFFIHGAVEKFILSFAPLPFSVKKKILFCRQTTNKKNCRQEEKRENFLLLNILWILHRYEILLILSAAGSSERGKNHFPDSVSAEVFLICDEEKPITDQKFMMKNFRCMGMCREITLWRHVMAW